MGKHVTRSFESEIQRFPAFPVASEGSFSAAQQEEGQVSETRGAGWVRSFWVTSQTAERVYYHSVALGVVTA